MRPGPAAGAGRTEDHKRRVNIMGGSLYSGIIAWSGRDGIHVAMPGSPRSVAIGRARRGESVRDAIERLTRTLVGDQRAIGRRHARRVASLFATPPNGVTPGPDGYGVGPWADQPFTVSVTGWPWTDRGRYEVSIWPATTTAGA